MFSIRISALAAVVLCAASASAVLDFDAYKKEVLKEPSLIRYYTFEDGYGEEVTNHAPPAEPGRIAFTGGPAGSLTIYNVTPYGHLPESSLSKSQHKPDMTPMEWTDGRLPGKSAIRSGETTLGLYRSGITGREFAQGATFAGWFRFEPEKGGRVLVKLGNAWNNGFVLVYFDGLLEFRPGNQGKTILQVPGLAPEIWHHLAFTVEDGAAKLYVNGELKAEKPFTGAIIPVKGSDYPPALPFFENSKRDATYLLIGANPRDEKQPPRGRFHLDELAIYNRALPAETLKKLCVAGRPNTTPDAQRADFAAWAKKKAVLDKIKLDIPRDTEGHFRVNEPIPATVALPAELAGAHTVLMEIETLTGKPVQTIRRPLAGGGTLTEALRFPACGVYWLDMKVLAKDGTLVKCLPEKFCLGIIPPAPARLSERNPMAYWADWEGLFHYDSPTRRMQMHGDGSHFEEVYAHYAKVIPNFRAYVWFYSTYIRPPQGDWDAGRKKNHDFFTMATRRMKGKNIFAFEMTSEPSNIDVKWYVQHLADARKIFNDAGLTQPMVPPGGSPVSIPMISDILKAGGDKYMDGISFHPYTPEPIRDFLFNNPIEKLKEISKGYSKEFFFWNTESGLEILPRVKYRPMTRAEAYATRWPSREGLFLGWVSHLPEEESAKLVVQNVLLSLLSGYRIYTHHHVPNVFGNPSLNTVALTALSGQIINNYAGIERLPLAGITDMCLFVKQTDGTRIAAVFSEKPTLLNFRLAPSKTYKTMDVYGNYGTMKTDAEGVLTIASTIAPFYIFDVPATMREIAPLAFELPAAISDRGEAKGRIAVKNSFRRQLVGALAAEPVLGAKLSFSSAQIDLKPGESTTVDFLIDGTDLKRQAYQFNVKLTDPDGKVIAAASKIAKSPGVIRMVPRVVREMPLDGDLAKWRNIPARTCDTLASVVHGKPNYAEIWMPQWLGKDDLSFSVKTCWRKGDGIYFLVDVTDDVLLPAAAEKTNLAFRYDCAELFFDSRPADKLGASMGDGADQAMIVPRASADAAACVSLQVRKDREHIRVEAVGRKTATGWLVEGRIAPNAKSEFQVQAGSQFLMDFLIDDTDKDELKWLRKSAMALDGNFGNPYNANFWGRYELSLDEVK